LNDNPTYSFVIPIYNEIETLPELERRLKEFLATLDGPSEVVLVNDGSRDGSDAYMNALAQRDKRYKVIHLSRNFGHQIAITAGIDHTVGNAVVIMDADLQDPPEAVHKMIEKWQEGFEIVYGIREHRAGESWFKKFTASAFYRFLRAMTDVDIPADTGDFRLVDRKAVDAFKLLREKSRFVRGMFSWIGFRQTGVTFPRAARFAGETKYPLHKMLKFAFDGVVSFSNLPLRFVLRLGVWVAGLSFAGGIWSIVMKLLGETVQGWTSLLLVVCFASGIQLIVLGIIGEYIGRICDEVRRRPLYFVREYHNLNPLIRDASREPTPVPKA
jgi:dolichol-phosphate mannosyltransferase